MSYLKRQGGVTLVELVLVLAITAGAITSAIAIRSSMRKDISFSTSIEQVKNQILAAKTESIQTVKDGDNGAGNSDSYNFGRAVEFLPDDPSTPFEENKNMRVSTIISSLDGDSGDGLQQKMAQCDQKWVTYKDGAEYKGTEKRAIIFQRKPEKIFVTPLNYNTSGGVVCSALAGQLGSGNTPEFGGYDSDNDGIPDDVDDCDYEYAPNTPNGCPDGTPPPPPDGCSATGYVCGLYGRFYIIPYLFFGGAPVNSSIMRPAMASAFTGETFGPEYGNTATWLPILRYKAKNPAARVSALWTGQIKVPANTTRKFCLNTDDGSYMKINNVVVTNNPDSLDQLEPQSSRCSEFTGGALDTWLDISIYYNQNDATEVTPFVGLVYKDASNNDVYVPGQDLRTVPRSTQLPSSTVRSGLRGEYFSNNSLSGEPFSVYTDDDATKPPYSKNSSFTSDLNPDSNVKQRTGQPWIANFSASVRWTGQIYLTSNQTLCSQMDNGVRVKIAGSTVIDDWDNTQSSKNSCITLGPSVGWTNIVIEARKNATSSYDGVGLSLDGNPVSLRRSLDYSFTTNNFQNTSAVTDHSKSQSCSNISDSNYMTYYRSGLWPSNNYKLDINYRYSWINPWVAPQEVCIKLNGNLLNNGEPFEFPYDTVNQMYRTYSLSNIEVPSSGAIDIKIGIIDRSLWCNGWCVEPIEIDRVDLWRGFDSTGNLITNKDKTSNNTEISIVGKIFSAISNTAFAQSACAAAQTECSILIFDNYNPDSSGAYTFYPDQAELEFGINGSSEKGIIKIDPQTNSITRDIDL